MTPEDVGRLLRDLAPRVLGAVARRHADFAAAEDAVQDAVVLALARWPADGLPANPAGWLHTVALRRLADGVRAEVARRRREEASAALVWADWAFVPPPEQELVVDGDDTLALLFTCAHPALTAASAVALTLRAVGGLTTAEIARAFLVPEATMAQRVARAKQAIRQSRVPVEVPGPAERPARRAAVLQVLYLIFNEGYVASAGERLDRPDLAAEAIRLARLLRRLLPDDAEAAGLLALMLLTHARRLARTGPAGELVPLDAQDRRLWDRAMIEEGTRLVEEALALGPAGPYALQAAIAALHDAAPSVAATDWPQVLALYDVLVAVQDNPAARLARLVALAMVEGPATGLAALDALEAEWDGGGLATGHRPDAVRAHLLEMAGDAAGAARHYRRAAGRTASVPERDYLALRAARAERAARDEEGG